MRMNGKKWMHVCKIMESIYANHRNIFPNKLLKLRWPDGKNAFKDADDLLWVKFVHHFNPDYEKEIILHTDYAPISWSFLPALRNIAVHIVADQCKNSEEDTVDNQMEIRDSIPFLIMWEDWDEDDTLEVHSCSDENIDKYMDPEYLFDMISKHADDYNFHFYIGIIDRDRNPVIYPSVHSGIPFEFSGMEKDKWVSKIKSYMEKSYKPLIIQCAEWDCDDFEIVYWLEKKSSKHIKIERKSNEI